ASPASAVSSHHAREVMRRKLAKLAGEARFSWRTPPGVRDFFFCAGPPCARAPGPARPGGGGQKGVKPAQRHWESAVGGVFDPSTRPAPPRSRRRSRPTVSEPRASGGGIGPSFRCHLKKSLPP